MMMMMVMVCPASVSSENNTLPEQQRSPQLSWKQGHLKVISCLLLYNERVRWVKHTTVQTFKTYNGIEAVLQRLKLSNFRSGMF